ncbi:acyltransferase [Microbacterium sp. HMWF026]|uniref:acyltransferase family protein n=1 Tax=Microbacterium sp. HMWF026 TaxID=2056861 RepID=UPI000D34640B|nr:acyltransferase family protein [Microbacterium sp. HMWF026]PTT18762.1 acyltransferase [Microbacterium sp. HMWF026]
MTASTRIRFRSGASSGVVEPPRRRADLDGLRALAITLVVAYHVWVGRVSGGVDVFLFLSAFLLTASFLRRMQTQDGLGVGSYWLRRFSRLLPPVAVTLLGVLVVAAAVYPPERWRAIWDQAVGSVFYVQNRVLADAAVDYYARTDQTSPLQHFWSLSVQGQVFLLWPLLILLAAGISRRTRLDAVQATAGVFGAVFVGSFVVSVIATAADQQSAYFSTPARLWEFALGSLVAVGLSAVRVRPTPRAAGVLVWSGIIGIVSCGLVLDVEGAFPGWAALWPTVSAALVVVGGQAHASLLPVRLLSARPLRGLASVSYAFYLVHWPILITWTVLSGRDQPGILAGTLIVAASLAVAWALTRWVDAPLARLVKEGGRPLQATAIVASILLVVTPVVIWRQAAVSSTVELGPDHPGSSAVLTGAVTGPFDAPPRPSEAEVVWPWFQPGDDCTESTAGRDETCAHLAGAGEDSLRVVVVGNSHSQQWGGMLEPLALERGWELTVVAAGGCPLGLDDDGTRPSGECAEWRERAFDKITALRPDLVVTVGSTNVAGSDAEYVSPGLERAIERLHARTEADVWVVRDNPRFDFDMWECGHGGAGDSCEVPLSGQQAPENPLAPLDRWDRVHAVDLTPLVCPDGLCRPFVGNIAVYFDDNHLTTDYTRSMSWAVSDLAPA